MEMLAYVFGLAAVPFDGVSQGQGFKIVHVPRVRSQAPERHGAQLVSCVLRRILHDAVAGSDVMQQEIAVRMNDLVAQSIGDSENSAIDNRSGGSGDNGADMAG